MCISQQGWLWEAEGPTGRNNSTSTAVGHTAGSTLKPGTAHIQTKHDSTWAAVCEGAVPVYVSQAHEALYESDACSAIHNVEACGADWAD